MVFVDGRLYEPEEREKKKDAAEAGSSDREDEHP
jgi:hypothetical protein